MKKFTVCLTTGLLAVVTSCMAATGPETMNLKDRFEVTGKKPAVIFPHRMHQSKLACTKCHDSGQGGQLSIVPQNIKGMSNDFHKKICWPCHVEMKVPKGKSCNTCHVKK
jgi:hypothetical protein